jgi:hypothetical protein
VNSYHKRKQWECIGRIFGVGVVMFGRDVEFIGYSGVAGDGFEWDMFDHEYCFEEFRGDGGGGDESLEIHFEGEREENGKERVE